MNNTSPTLTSSDNPTAPGGPAGRGAPMPVELIPATPRHADELGGICHHAFSTLQDRHNVPRDMPTEEVGRAVISSALKRADYPGVAAVGDGRLLGSNFIMAADDVIGVGPITVAPDAQSRGVGAKLMRWAIDEAHRLRGDRPDVRLFQEAINPTSLSLYTRLGFHWRDTAAWMLPRPAETDDATVRPMTGGDLPEVDRLSRQHHGHSRVNDARQLLDQEYPAFIRERGGRVVAYQIATLFGHAAGETVEDLIAITAQSARHIPQPMAVIIVPLSQHTLFRAALGAGHRVAKMLNYMTLGSYTAPPGPCLPSILW